MRQKYFIFFLAVLFLSLASCPYQARAANELPYLSIHNNLGVPQNIKRYFYESNGQKETIVIVPQYKDISGNEPIKAITKGEKSERNAFIKVLCLERSERHGNNKLCKNYCRSLPEK